MLTTVDDIPEAENTVLSSTLVIVSFVSVTSLFNL